MFRHSELVKLIPKKARGSKRKSQLDANLLRPRDFSELAYLILNLSAGRGEGARGEVVQRALRRAGVQVTMAATRGPGEGVELARAAVLAGHSPIIAAGGDGTLNEVARGILKTDVSTPLGVMPLGSGNDLAFHLGIPGEMEAAARVIAGGNARSLDVIMAGDQPFINCCGLAIEAHISTVQLRLSRRWGRLRYLLATLIGILNPPSWWVRMEWDEDFYEGPVTLLSVGNCRRTGGLFYITPDADPWDGLITFTFVHLPRRRQIARALPRTLRAGAGGITAHPAVRQIRCERLRVMCPRGLPMHLDGELRSELMKDTTFGVYPGRLRVLCP